MEMFYKLENVFVCNRMNLMAKDHKLAATPLTTPVSDLLDAHCC